MASYLQQHDCGVDYYVPQLSDRPDQAIKTLESLLQAHLGQQPTLIGSSLGGYYATWLACRYDLRAVLINPAVRPYDLLGEYLGPNKNYYSGEEYELTAEHIEQLRRLETEAGSCYQKLHVYLETGDEVLDYRQAEQKYRDAQLHVFNGGDHSFVNYDAQRSDILNNLHIFCQQT